MAHPIRRGRTPSGRYVGLVGAPRPWTSPPTPGHPKNIEGLCTPVVPAPPPSLVHPLIVSPFLAPTTAWYMMHAKADTMGMTQWVEPFLDLLGVATIEPLQGIADLTSVDLADSMLAQRQGISTSLVPPPPLPQLPSQHSLLHQSFQLQAPDPPPAPTRQAVTPKSGG